MLVRAGDILLWFAKRLHCGADHLLRWSVYKSLCGAGDAPRDALRDAPGDATGSAPGDDLEDVLGDALETPL